MKKLGPDEWFSIIAKKFSANRKLAFFTTIILGAIIHLQVYTNDINSPDSLWMTNYHGISGWEFSLGRWGLSLVSLLRGSAVSSVITTSIALILMGLTAIVLVELFGIKNKISIVMVSSLLAVAPTFATNLTYQYCADSYTLAMFLSSLSVYLIYKNKKSIVFFLLASICVTFSMGLYQSYIGVVITLCVMVPILELIKNDKEIKDIWKDIFRSILMVIVGVILYYVLTQIVLKLFHIKLASYSGANKIGFSILKTIPKAIKQAYITFHQFFFEDNILKNTYWKRQILNSFFFIILLINYILAMIKYKSIKKPAKIIHIVIFTAILPIAINFIELIAQERKIDLLMGASLYLPFIFMISISELLGYSWKEIIIKWLGALICIIIIATYAISDQCTYIARQMTHDQAYSTMIRIIDRIENCDGYQKGMKLCFAGTIDEENYPRNSKVYDMAIGHVSKFGEFWISYDGSRATMEKFMQKYCGINIKWCEDKEYKSIVNSQEYKNMKIFPAQESVKVINHTVVVKLSDNPIMPK